MRKIKFNTGLASIMIVASIFAGWQTLLLVTLFLFIFSEVEDKVKDIAIKVITFYIGYYIVSLGFDIIMDAGNLVVDTIRSFVTTFNTYADSLHQIDAIKIERTIDFILKVVDSTVSILFILVKIGFVLSVLTGKPKYQNILFKKISEYVNKAVSYVSSMNADAAFDSFPTSLATEDSYSSVPRMSPNSTMNQNASDIPSSVTPPTLEKTYAQETVYSNEMPTMQNNPSMQNTVSFHQTSNGQQASAISSNNTDVMPSSQQSFPNSNTNYTQE